MAGAALGTIGGKLASENGANATTSAFAREAFAFGATEGIKAAMEPKKWQQLTNQVPQK